MNRTAMLSATCAIAFCGCTLFDISSVRPPAKECRIEKTDFGVKCVRGGLTVWDFAVEGGKPRVHPLRFPDGSEITVCRPADHMWHRGLWFCWKYLNGVNFWETDASGKSVGEQRADIKKVTIDADRAEVVLSVAWIADGRTLLSEERKIFLAAPDEKGAYSIRWLANFKALVRTELSSSPPHDTPDGMRGGYAGFSLRLGDFAGICECKSDGTNFLAYRSPKNGASITVKVVKAPPTSCYHWSDNRFTSFSPVRGKSIVLECGQNLSLEYEVTVK